MMKWAGGGLKLFGHENALRPRSAEDTLLLTLQKYFMCGLT